MVAVPTSSTIWRSMFFVGQCRETVGSGHQLFLAAMRETHDNGRMF